MVATVKGGIGQDMRIVIADPNATVILFKAMLACDVAYGFSAALIKLSVLAFYWRIFPTSTVRWGCYILAAITIMTTISFQVVNFLLCRPLEAYWYLGMRDLPGTTCINASACFFLNALINCIIDLAILALPIRDVVRLQTTRRKKIGIITIFLFGGL
ncbi:hypothetical protein B0I35DRAFT_445429 [Stachybotrys elegans]|uniref:Rhodopsin domain-containing protein n=1 Tax=Stachybotrys elegans TaxID=80388 RepID=A0A8K0SES7_9HYPO|nr:hypothetical protein B0I35DRAFT_445429 [Stachybotrys elegans]